MQQTNLFDVIVVGELNVDLIFDGLGGKLPEIGKEILADEMILTLGSSSAIFASNLSMLGPAVSFIGKVGKDNFASLVMESLEEKGVDTSGIIQSPDYYTGITVACSYGQDRAMVTYPGAMDHLTLQDISPGQLKQGRHMHLSTVFMQKGIRPDVIELFKRAKEAGLTTSFDPQWDPDETWDLDLHEFLPHVDVFLPNIEEIKHLTRTENLRDALQSVSDVANIIVVKKGSKGLHLWTRDLQLDQPIFNNPRVADTIGAGDSFNAGFISRFIKKVPLKECLEFGALTGAINTTRPGGTTAFSDMDSIRQIARTNFNREIECS